VYRLFGVTNSIGAWSEAMTKQPHEQYETKEAQERFEAALKSAMNTPHKPLKDKPKVKKAKKKAKTQARK
jgi:hypothetical protein